MTVAPLQPEHALAESSPRHDLRVEVLDTLAAVELNASAWAQFEAEAQAPLTYFQSSSWCLNWLRAHRELYIRPHIFMLWQDNKIVAIWPCMVRRLLRVATELCSVGDPFTQYGGILCRNGTLSVDQIKVLRQALAQVRDVSAIRIQHVADNSPLRQILDPAHVKPALNTLSAILALDPFETAEDYKKSLGSRQRRNRDRRQRKLAELGTLTFQILMPDDPDFLAVMERSLAMKARWLKMTGRFHSNFESQAHRDFLLERGQHNPGMMAFALRLNGLPIAVEVGALHHGHYYAYLGSFDWDHGQHSPGKVLMDMLIGWLITNKAKAYDLLAHPQNYKETWTNSTIGLVTYGYSLNMVGYATTELWAGRLRPLAKSLYENMPPGLRHVLAVITRRAS
jgi:CelD/BcsL family acetyltransferase involved in cellulose biosynthesis